MIPDLGSLMTTQAHTVTRRSELGRPSRPGIMINMAVRDRRGFYQHGRMSRSRYHRPIIQFNDAGLGDLGSNPTLGKHVHVTTSDHADVRVRPRRAGAGPSRRRARRRARAYCRALTHHLEPWVMLYSLRRCYIALTPAISIAI